MRASFPVFRHAADIHYRQRELQYDQRVGIGVQTPDNPEHVAHYKHPEAHFPPVFQSGPHQLRRCDGDHHGGPLHPVQILHLSILRCVELACLNTTPDVLCDPGGRAENSFRRAQRGVSHRRFFVELAALAPVLSCRYQNRRPDDGRTGRWTLLPGQGPRVPLVSPRCSQISRLGGWELAPFLSPVLAALYPVF